MSALQAILLGVVQGLTEFLPISSSAHLILVPWFLGWDPPGLSFDVALHWGTLIGLLIYFRQDVVQLIHKFGMSLSNLKNSEHHLPWKIILGTIPAGLMGLLFEKQAETIFRSPWVTVFTLSFVGLLLLWADKKGTKQKTLDDLTWLQAFLIGAAQGFAIVPGVSRSGITITMALLLALKRTAAVRFSFLLAIPIIFAAGLLKIQFFIDNLSNGIFWMGFGSAAISGYAAIAFLLKFVRTKSFTPFVIYRLLLAGIILIQLFRV